MEMWVFTQIKLWDTGVRKTERCRLNWRGRQITFASHGNTFQTGFCCTLEWIPASIQLKVGNDFRYWQITKYLLQQEWGTGLIMLFVFIMLLNHNNLKLISALYWLIDSSLLNQPAQFQGCPLKVANRSRELRSLRVNLPHVSWKHFFFSCVTAWQAANFTGRLWHGLNTKRNCDWSRKGWRRQRASWLGCSNSLLWLPVRSAKLLLKLTPVPPPLLSSVLIDSSVWQHPAGERCSVVRWDLITEHFYSLSVEMWGIKTWVLQIKQD